MHCGGRGPWGRGGRGVCLAEVVCALGGVGQAAVLWAAGAVLEVDTAEAEGDLLEGWSGLNQA